MCVLTLTNACFKTDEMMQAHVLITLFGRLTLLHCYFSSFVMCISTFQVMNGNIEAVTASEPLFNQHFFSCDRKDSCTYVVKLNSGDYKLLGNEEELNSLIGSAIIWKKTKMPPVEGKLLIRKKCLVISIFSSSWKSHDSCLDKLARDSGICIYCFKNRKWCNQFVRFWLQRKQWLSQEEHYFSSLIFDTLIYLRQSFTTFNKSQQKLISDVSLLIYNAFPIRNKFSYLG